MISPLTRVLLKIFAKGFYRVHGAFMLFSFIGIVVYFFFIEVLNQTHLQPDQIVQHNLILVLTVISSPVLVTILLLMWLAFTIKSWGYMRREISFPANRFLFYSSTSMSKVTQWRSWFMVQMTLSLPLMAYGAFCLVIGFIFGYYVIPVFILLYTMILSAVSAWIYVRQSNRLISTGQVPLLTRLVSKLRKPFFSLFLYHCFHKLRLSFFITKGLSFVLVTGSAYLLADINDKVRVGGIVALLLVAAHAMLIFESYRFEFSYLRFSRNFPYSRTKMYCNWVRTYMLCTLPENIWLVFTFEVPLSLALIVFHTSTAMIFRNLLYSFTLDVRRFVSTVFYLFVAFFIAILMKMFWLLLPVSILISVFMFWTGYYRQRTGTKI